MWREFNLINSFTLEVSFCGPTIGLYKDCHFTIPLLKDMGKHFCQTLIDYANNQQKVQEAIKELEMLFPQSQENGGLPTLLQGGNDKNDRGYFGYNGVSPREGMDDEEEAASNPKKKGNGGDAKKKKSKANAPSGLRKQVSEMQANQLKNQMNNGGHQGFKHHSVSSDNMVLGLKGDDKRKQN
jgi:hypothetical protein